MTAKTLSVPLLLSPLGAAGYNITRSGIRWLCNDGHVCRPSEPIAYCYITLSRRPDAPATQAPLNEELSKVRVFLAPRVGGRLVQAGGMSRGGFMDIHAVHHHWSVDTQIGTLECSEADVQDQTAAVENVRLLLVGGGVAAPDPGQLAGWPSVRRAWWSEGGEEFGSLLSLGICEQMGLILGERWSFFELFALLSGPVHAAFVPDDVLVPSASALSSQLKRTTAEQHEIIADLALTFGPLLASQNQGSPRAIADWAFAGRILEALCRSPLLESADVLTARGIQTLGPPGAVLLSMNSESCCHLRHKRLGYIFSCHYYRLADLGPTLTQWLRQEFDIFSKTLEESKQDYLELIDLVQARTNAHLLMLNNVSANFSDECFCYAPFDKPLARTLSNVRSQEMNLLVYELARERDISIVDLDRLAAELGNSQIPDGVHASGYFQDALRAQIVEILHELGLPGFSLLSPLK